MQEMKLNKEVKLVKYRSGCHSFGTDSTICLHHKVYFLEKYPIEQKCCFDPFMSHKSKVKFCPKVLNLIDVEKFTFVEIIPGKKCCTRCYERLEGVKLQRIRE